APCGEAVGQWAGRGQDLSRKSDGRSPRTEVRGLRRCRATHTGRRGWWARLPEEVVDHVDHLAAVDVHQQDVVVVADPAIRSVDFGQAVLPRIVDPVAAAEEQ